MVKVRLAGWVPERPVREPAIHFFDYGGERKPQRRNNAQRSFELERLRMALNDNILTPEVEANGYGQVDMARLDRAISQIALTYDFKAKPKASDIFDPSFLPPAADRNTD